MALWNHMELWNYAKYLGVGSPVLAKPAGILMFRRNLNIRSMDLNCSNVAIIL